MDKNEFVSHIKPESVADQWVIVADTDLPRLELTREILAAVGFVREQIIFALTGASALELIVDKKSAIVFVDDSIGVDAFKEIQAKLVKDFGTQGFFLFAITEGNSREFVQFSAMAAIDGILFRPFRSDEFKLRVSEAFAVKWQNRLVKPELSDADIALVRGQKETELFQKAIEKEHRLGNRDPLTPDSKISSIFGLKPVTHSAVNAGKKSFEKVRLSFRAVARNGEPLNKPFPIHAVEVDASRATFECPSDAWENGDHVSIEADIVHGDDSYVMRIEATVTGEAGVGLMAVEFDEGNRTRFEAAMSMVAKRFKELKDFFKYAKGA